LNALGIYLLGSLGFVVVALIEFSIIIFMRRASDKLKNKVQCTSMMKKKMLKKTLLKKKKEKYTNGLSEIHNQIDDKRSKALSENDRNKDAASQCIDKIDFISFWLFLAAFLIFNTAYWKSY